MHRPAAAKSVCAPPGHPGLRNTSAAKGQTGCVFYRHQELGFRSTREVSKALAAGSDAESYRFFHRHTFWEEEEGGDGMATPGLSHSQQHP
jgi:hypothetical protein